VDRDPEVETNAVRNCCKPLRLATAELPENFQALGQERDLLLAFKVPRVHAGVKGGRGL
jgi:hypothetical protein